MAHSFTDSGTEYTTEAADALWSNSVEWFQRSGQSQEDPLSLVKLLRRMLIIDPAGRPTEAELVHDPSLGTSDRPETRDRDPGTSEQNSPHSPTNPDFRSANTIIASRCVLELHNSLPTYTCVLPRDRNACAGAGWWKSGFYASATQIAFGQSMGLLLAVVLLAPPTVVIRLRFWSEL